MSAEELATSGDARLIAGDVDGADDAYRRAVALDEWCVPALVGLAVVAERCRHWLRVIGYGRRAVAVDPAHVAARVLLGIGLAHQHRPAEAVTHLRFVVDHGAGAAVRAELAMLYERLDRLDEAAEQLRLAVDDAGDPPSFGVDLPVPRHHNLHYALFRVLSEAGRRDEAESHYQRGRQLDPMAHLQYWYGYIVDRSEVDDPMELARQLLEIGQYEALTIAASNPLAREFVETIAGYMLATQQAGSLFLSARLRIVGDCLIDQDASALFDLVQSDAGRTLVGLAEVVAADSAQLAVAERRAAEVPLTGQQRATLSKLAERFVRMDPESGWPLAEIAAAALTACGTAGACWYVVADARYRTGDLGGARQALDRAIPQLERDGDIPGLLDALARLATVEAAQQQLRAAVTVLDRLIALADEHGEHGRASVARANRAIDLFNLGDLVDTRTAAYALAEQVLADEELRKEIGAQVAGPLTALLSRTEPADGDRSAGGLLASLATLTDDTDAMIDLAYEQLRAGRHQEAIVLLEHAASRDSVPTVVLVVLGQAHAMAGDTAKADDYLQRVLNLRRFAAGGETDLWPALITLADIADSAGDAERAVGLLSDALDLACSHADRERERDTLVRLSQKLLNLDARRAVAVADRVYGGLSKSSPVVALANECADEWSAGRYPRRQLRMMQRLLSRSAGTGGWVKEALVVALAAVDSGAERLAMNLATRVVEVVASGDWGDLNDEMHARSILGRAHRLAGGYVAARTEYERAGELAELVFDARSEADIRARLAVVLRHLDRPDLAVHQYQRAIRIDERLDAVEDTATNRTNLVYSLLAVGRPAEALTCAAQALTDADRASRPDLARYVLLLVAHHIDPADLPADLAAAVAELPTTVEAEPATFRWLYEHLHRAARHIRSGANATAVNDLRAMLDQVDRDGDVSIRTAAHLESARTLAPVAADLAWTFAGRAITLAEAHGAHGLLLADCRQLLLDLALTTGHTAKVDQLVTDLQDDWARLRRLLPEDTDRVAVADRAVRHLHSAVRHYLANDPACAFTVWDAARAPALAEAIAPGRTTGNRPPVLVLSIGVVADDVVVMVDGPDRVAPVSVPARLNASDLDRIVSTFRREMQLFHGHGSQTWARLAAPLLSGAADYLPQDGLIVAILDAALQELPLHAVPLPDGRPLLARCAVTYAPSLAVLAALEARRATTHPVGGLLTVGVAFPEEARAISARFGGTCRAGSRFAKAQLQDDITAAGMLHFACHGQYDRDIPANSGLVIATARQPTPDEILSIRDLDAWSLDVGLVTLSACDTALGTASPSELLGLARSFLRVGAQSVLAALWKIDDSTTQRFMLDLYTEMFHAQPGSRLDVASALRVTQLRYAAVCPTHAWAGFRLVGLPSVTWQEPSP